MKSRTSLRLGTFSITDSPLARSAAAIIGSTAFLAPPITTLPSSRVGPSITNLSTDYPSDSAHLSSRVRGP
jgi:hypothetical protein